MELLSAIAAGIVLIALVSAAVMIFQPRVAVRLLAKANPEVLFLVDTNRRAVALTIDDAPSPALTRAILDRLRRHGARATFFVIGSRVPGHEDLLREIVASGSELGNHMLHDRPSILASRGSFSADLARTTDLLGPGHSPRWFRPASGWFTPRMLREIARQGYRCCLGSIFPHDSKLKSPRLIADFILNRVFPGAIIVLHDGGPHRRHTLEVLDRILPRLVAQGYEITTVSTLVASARGPRREA